MMQDDLIRRSSVVKMIQRHCESVGPVIRDKHLREVHEIAHNQLIEAVALIPAEGSIEDEKRT